MPGFNLGNGRLAGHSFSHTLCACALVMPVKRLWEVSFGPANVQHAV